MVRIRAAPTPTPRRTRTIKLSRRAQRWNSDVEDRILLQVMMLPELDPPIQKRYPRGYWMIKSIAPRLPNGGYLPQFFQGDWLTLLKNLRNKGYDGSPLFCWRNVEFGPFKSLYLRGRWRYLSKQNCQDGQTTKEYIRQEIKRYKDKTLVELNTPFRKSLGGKKFWEVIKYTHGRRNKFLPRGWNDPERYF
ncbi:hypothetical protein PSTG_16058 [Puccinia striiformis f. sp. tritici PST-78]|uniref:Uncharacterized protein n=1 Tax=Puccinia striiformis f. sp. tritici PST-78 TaxID=1165861 RepID=A0A0L0UUT1_9BASI|nr:hypothetical protein PSTG_16058 [Puccinia striiformis f. sp. tritici PST-78]